MDRPHALPLGACPEVTFRALRRLTDVLDNLVWQFVRLGDLHHWWRDVGEPSL